MMHGFLDVNHCRLCGKSHLQDVYNFGSIPVGDRYCTAVELSESTLTFPLLLRRCYDCGHWQLSGVVDPDLLYGKYLYETGISPGLVGHFQDYAKSVAEICLLPANAFVVDIGSNSGVLLEQFQKLNLQVLGVEPATSVAKCANDRGVPTHVGYFTESLAKEIVLQHGKAMLITANNVLANIHDLDAMFSAMKILVDDNGVIVLESGYALDTIGQFVIDNIYHEHISYFTIAPLQRFFLQRGLRIFHAERVPTKGGSIRLFICKQTSVRTEARSVQGLMQLEEELGFGDGSAALLFVSRAQMMQSILKQRLAELAAQGPLVGYGASVGVTTILYWLDAGNMFSCLVDDNRIKQGRFSPGFHLPVHPSSHLLEIAPPIVINLAWRYFHLIARKNKAYLEQGGHLQQLLPWPWVL